MITEDYVSFETAKLLKEKGFDGKLPFIYVDTEKSDREVHLTDTLCNYNDGHIKDVISAPTLQMAMKWLRNVHKIIPIVLTGGYSQNPFYYWFRIDIIKEGKWKDAIYREDEKEFPTYEQACEAAIKYCLDNLI